MRNTEINGKPPANIFRFFGILIMLLIAGSATSQAAGLEKELNDAIMNNQAAEVREILAKGGKQLRETIKNNAMYYIKHTARYGTADIVRQVLEGCDLKNEKQALNEALIASGDNHSFAEVIPLLLSYGADPNNEYQMNYALNRLVMLYSGKPNKTDQLLATIQALLKKGAYIDSFDDAMETPLMIACRNEDLAVVRLLLANGANPGLTNKDMKSALSYAPAGSAVAAEFTRKNSGATIAGKGEPALVAQPDSGQSLFGTPAGDQEQYLKDMSFDNYTKAH